MQYASDIMRKRPRVGFIGGQPAMADSPNLPAEQQSKSKRDYEPSVKELSPLLFLDRIDNSATIQWPLVIREQ
jgi:hypothetical protein